MSNLKTITIMIAAVCFFAGCTSSETSGRKPASELGGGEEAFSIYDENPRTSKRRKKKTVYKAPLAGVGKYFNSKCRGFIAKDGSIGPWGKEFLKAMNEIEASKGGKNIFFGNAGEDDSRLIRMGSRCKSTEYFQTLTRSQQEHIWAWTWAAIAQSESSCNPKARARGIWNKKYGRYNRADGLVQLEYSTQTRSASGRSRKFCLDRTDSQAIRFQARCASSIMANKHSGKFLYTEGRSTTYWDKLRRKNGNIFRLLKKHPLCR